MRSIRSRAMQFPRLTFVVKGLVSMGCVIGLALSSAHATSSTPDPDPLVAEIVEMLNAGVEESVITRWLESTGRQPADIGSRGMIALTEAGASEKLITTLLQRLEDQGKQASTEDGNLSLGRAESRDVGIGNQAAGSSLSTGAAVEATFQLRAKQMFTEEDEPDSPRDPLWDVYLYLDGELIAWTTPSLQAERVTVERLIEPGHRELRVVLQRYEALRGGWRYESLSVPTVVGFEVRTGDPIEIEVEMKRTWGLWRDREDSGPLTFSVRQSGQILAEQSGTGGNPDRWRPVCEDVEANFSESEGVPRRFRSSMNRCVRWADLWTGAGVSTSREAILTSLAECDFQPPVR